MCNGRIVFGEESSQLREQIKSLLGQSKKIVLNLGGVSYIDSGGVGILIALLTLARTTRGGIKTAQPHPTLRGVIHQTETYANIQVFYGDANTAQHTFMST